MSFRTSRVSRLEARQRRQHPAELAHGTNVVQVPSEISEPHWHEWLAQQPCRCGQVGCPERRIGLLVPTRGQTAGARGPRMNDIRRRLQHVEGVLDDLRPIVRVRWSEEVAADDGEDDEGVEVIRLAWEPRR